MITSTKDMFFVGVCKQDNSKSYILILIRFSEEVGNGLRNNWFSF